jgi:hypothetical protein
MVLSGCHARQGSPAPTIGFTKIPPAAQGGRERVESIAGTLAIAIPARYVFHLAGSWRWIYVVGASMALYLNVFVLIAQLFMKVPALKALAPTQSEPPFLAAQILVLLIFVGLTILAAKRFHLQPARA